MSRTARIERKTSESHVVVDLDLDGTGQNDISTGVGFYDHMLTAFSRHSLIDPHAPTAAAAAGGTLHFLVAVVLNLGIFALGFWVFNREAPRIAEEL